MADFVGLAATAKRLIEANGRDVTLTKDDRTANDPAKPWRGPPSPGTPTTLTVRACVVPLGGGLGREFADEAGFIMKRGTEAALVAADSVAPTVIEEFDALLDGSEVWKVLEVHTLKPATVPLLYALELRK